MEGNKDESEKCIIIALKAFSSGDSEKALKFLYKAQKLYPSKKAEDLISQMSSSSAGAASGSEDQGPAEASASNGSASASENVRHRRAGNQPSSGAETQQQDYTTDQLEAVRKIRKCKDYYEILGLEKDCSDDELKKSYRKLALKFHPDKNKAPGATEAFKAIGNAFSVLNDPEKKQRYDQFGSEAEQVTTHRHSHGRHEYDYTRGGFEGDISAEELFNMFFGGGFNSGSRPTRRMYRTRSTFHHSEQNESPYTFLLQLSPLLFMVIISLLSSFLVSDPLYSLQRGSKYTFERKTQNLQVPYYVKPDFSTEFKGSLRNLEQQIEDEHTSNLRSNCYRERSYKESMLWRARNFGDRSLYQKAQDMKTPSCDNLQKIYGGG